MLLLKIVFALDTNVDERWPVKTKKRKIAVHNEIQQYELAVSLHFR